MPLLRCATVLALCALMSSLALAQNAAPAEPALCRSLCERDKQQCRQGNSSADAAATAATVGLVGMVLNQPKAFEGTAAVDAKRNMLDVLADRQRADDSSKSAAREWADRCNQTFMQCLGSCAAPVQPASSASSPR